jgi:energy-coupling factor transport system permease protein
MSGDTRYAYREANTFMHSLDPISKMVWLFCLSLLIIVLIIPWVQITLWVAILFMAFALTGLSLGEVWGFVRFIYLLGGLIFVMQSLFVPGGPVLWHWGPLTVEQHGMLIGAAAGLRIVNLATSSMIFLVSTSPRDLAIAVTEKLKMPMRATQALFLALRFLPLLEDEYADLMDAHRVRGAGGGNGLRERAARLQRFTVPFLFSSLRRAQVTALAMDAKAFGAFPTKTFYHQVDYRPRGRVFAAIWVVLLIVGIVLVVTGRLQRIGDLDMALAVLRYIA